ncbi:MAG: DUF4349 domain-containing protein [Actinomycetota bacterium]|nr:DUF4349 domain-containing protein [Actinomycetota bacterium]MDQ3217368.1 DUF4349 domain-containing protein [Actinomycetota bacterium]
MRSWRIMAAAATLTVVATACSGSDLSAGGADAGGGGSSSGVGSATHGDAELRVEEAQLGAGASTNGGQTAARLPTVGPSVIKTGYLKLTVSEDGFSEATQDAVALAGRFSGFVLSTSIEGKDSRSGTLVIRVPSDRFEELVNEVKNLGDVRSESISGQDVTQEFVDLESRLRNLRAQEAVLLRLFDKATTVAATIRVQSELGRVQLESEQLRGRLRYLEDQTSLATLSITVAEKGVPAPATRGTLAKAWDRALEGALGVVAAVIVGAGTLLPVFLLILVGVAIFRQVRPRFTS